MKLEHQKASIADRLMALPHNWRNWGLGLCYGYLRTVKGFLWADKRMERIH